METTGQPVTVEIKHLNASGAVTNTVTYSLGGFEAKQVNAFAGFAPAVTTTNGVVQARVTAGGGKVILYMAS